MDRSILVVGSESVEMCLDASIAISCTDIYGHINHLGQEMDWFGEIEELAGVMGNISADPLFCNPAVHLRVHEESPCNATCGLMGAEPVGCATTSIEEAVRESSWGMVKRIWNQ